MKSGSPRFTPIGWPIEIAAERVCLSTIVICIPSIFAGAGRAAVRRLPIGSFEKSLRTRSRKSDG